MVCGLFVWRTSDSLSGGKALIYKDLRHIHFMKANIAPIIIPEIREIINGFL